MPFGLTNSPATFQRLMKECLGHYNVKICIIYLDHIIIFANHFEENLERLDLVLTRLNKGMQFKAINRESNLSGKRVCIFFDMF